MGQGLRARHAGRFQNPVCFYWIGFCNRTFFEFLQVEASLKKWGKAYVYSMLANDVATVGTVDMWLYR